MGTREFYLPRRREGFTAPRAADRVLRSPAAESLPNARRVANLRCARAGRGQRRVVRGATPRAARARASRRRMRAARVPGRQQPPYAQHAHHAHRSPGGPHRRLSRGGILAGPGQGDGRAHRREARAHDHPRHRGPPAVDAAPWRALPGPARRHAAARAHQRVLPRRRQGAPQRVLPRGRALGAEISYESEVVGLAIDGGRFTEATLACRGAERRVRAKAVVAAAGGFESNLAWLREAWGDAIDNFIVRGTPYNMGKVLKLLLAQGAKAVSDPLQGHCVAIDARSPRFDGGIVTRVDAVSLGIVVNREAQRFYDEGEDSGPSATRSGGGWWPRSPARSAIRSSTPSPWDASCRPCSRRSRRARSASWRACSSSIGRCSRRRCVNSTARCGPAPSTIPCSTIAAPRDSIRPRRTGRARSTRRRTTRTRCAPASPSPTWAWPSTSVRAWCSTTDEPASNVFAAGEIMAGNILGKGYLAGIGMAIGTTFGRIAGEEAARLVLG